MKKYIITVIITLLAIGFASAQTTISIGPLSLGTAYSESQIVSILGNPTSKSSRMDDASGYVISFSYPTLDMEVDEYGIYDLLLKKGCAYKVNGLVGVGDPISKISLLNGAGTIQAGTWYNKPATLFYGKINNQQMAYPIVFYHSGNTISQIGYTIYN